jgi:hypothetical protein
MVLTHIIMPRFRRSQAYPCIYHELCETDILRPGHRGSLPRKIAKRDMRFGALQLVPDPFLRRTLIP